MSNKIQAEYLDLDSDIKIRNTLLQLNNLLGFTASSFWLIDDNFNLSNPIGASTLEKPSLLMDYKDSLYRYDDFYPAKYFTKLDLSAPIIPNTAPLTDNPYTMRLAEEHISHACSVLLKKDNTLWGTIALFSEYGKTANLSSSNLKSLSSVLPFVKDSLETTLLSSRLRHNTITLETALNSMDTGVIIFDNSTNSIVYSNSISQKYCYEFVPLSSSRFVVSDFIHQIIRPFDRPFSNLKNLSVDLSTPTGKLFHIRIEEHKTGSDNVIMLFITPQISCETSIRNGRLFAALTPKEREITLLITQGLTNSQIAEHLFISLSTVKSHVQHIFEKANVTNRTSLLAVLHELDNNS